MSIDIYEYRYSSIIVQERVCSKIRFTQFDLKCYNI